MSYSTHVRPMTLNGVKCVIVDKALQQEQPGAFSFLMGFARENDLQILDPANQDEQK